MSDKSHGGGAVDPERAGVVQANRLSAREERMIEEALHPLGFGIAQLLPTLDASVGEGAIVLRRTGCPSLPNAADAAGAHPQAAGIGAVMFSIRRAGAPRGFGMDLYAARCGVCRARREVAVPALAGVSRRDRADGDIRAWARAHSCDWSAS